ncbi:unnamed protein product [Soboliphyme baturini]|uniref:CCT-alpha n=1 Tax=Soboliphyme baturini TaxID=241478 RepID=A0A183IXC7_9BILA|nr:unnamed protein product [Soboliphyme baturini]
MMEVEHPAAKVLVELAQLQDEEVGDGTTSVVIIAAQLLKAADELVSQKIHPTTVMSGYRLACKEALKYMQEKLSINIDELGRECVLAAAKTTMSSKLIGPESDFFAGMIIEAVEAMKYSDGQGGFKYAVEAVNILKSHGGSTLDSLLVRGYALNCTVASPGMPKRIVNPKICCLDFGLQKVKMHLGINIELENPEKIEAIRREEIDIMKRRVDRILKTGVNVILTTGGADNVYIRQVEEAGAALVRRCLKKDLKRIAKATGGKFIFVVRYRPFLYGIL